MSLLTDFVVKTLESAGESKLEDLLQNLHDQHPEEYYAAIYGGHALVNALKPIVNSTATKIDDAIILGLDEALNNSAAKNGITFVVKPAPVVASPADDNGGDSSGTDQPRTTNP